MNKVNNDCIVDLVFNLTWKSDSASHTDCYQASNVNIWRDHFPPALLENIMDKYSGDRIELSIKQGDILPKVESQKIFKIKSGQFSTNLDPSSFHKPCAGRFYPKGILQGIANVFKENIEPFRLVSLDNGHMYVDFNHPLAGRDLKLTTMIGHVENKDVERGGTSIDWMETLTAGPGMQARWQSKQTDYFCDDAFFRDDATPDSEFYLEPRFTQHIDDTAIEMVRNTYDRFLDDGMRVLAGSPIYRSVPGCRNVSVWA
jgi:FKBP-type peptidyl-prolyl cis-trans isomerase 2